MVIRLTGALDESDKMVAFDATQWLQTHSDSESGHHLAWEAIGTAPGRNDGLMGQIPSLWYEIVAKRNRSLFVKPLIRNLYMRGQVRSRVRSPSNRSWTSWQPLCMPIRWNSGFVI
jgi:hypothetical protein